MSNVYSNASFAVLSVMQAVDSADPTLYRGSTVFVQKKPESDYGNITILSYAESTKGSVHNLRVEDFNQQAAFEANVVPKIQSDINSMNATQVVMANSNISPVSYTMDGKINP